MRTAILFFFAATISFAQWGGGAGGGKSLNEYKKVSVSGRDIHVYAPSGLKAKSPLLISCHGMNQDPNYQQENTHWEAVADTAGFVVVYPRGGTEMSTWDISGNKDTKWMTEIIAQMVKDYDIDEKRVYLSGFSMGGMFTYNAMSKIADKIAAYAPTSGTNVMGASKAQRPVPIIHPHGTTDDVLPYNQVEGFLKNYRDQFNCPSQAEVQDNYPHQGEKATMYTWGPCDGGVYIKHMKLEGRGHMPSKNEVSDIWNFVKQWSVDGKIGETKPESSSAAPASSADVAKSSSSGVTGPKSSGVATGSSSSGRGFWGGNRSSSSGSHHHHGFGSSSSITSLAVGSSSSIGGLAVGSSSSGIGGQFAAIAQPKDPSLLLVSVYKSSDNYIVVSNAQGKTITVFNSLGNVVQTTRGLGNQQKVYTGAKGVYIVKVGSRTFKTAL
jgi:poly(hydroxyalkanoate) depolymerase family esterase